MNFLRLFINLITLVLYSFHSTIRRAKAFHNSAMYCQRWVSMEYAKYSVFTITSTSLTHCTPWYYYCLCPANHRTSLPGGRHRNSLLNPRMNIGFLYWLSSLSHLFKLHRNTRINYIESKLCFRGKSKRYLKNEATKSKSSSIVKQNPGKDKRIRVQFSPRLSWAFLLLVE